MRLTGQAGPRECCCAFALAQYQRDNGRYPETARRARAKVPRAGPARSLLRPHALPSDGKRLLLYSVGENGQDDGGRGHDDDPKGDDIVVRMPSLPPK